MKQRYHKTVGETDIYPEIDQFIPEAVHAADEQYPDKSIPNYAESWNVAYLGEMNRILAKENLRVL